MVMEVETVSLDIFRHMAKCYLMRLEELVHVKIAQNATLELMMHKWDSAWSCKVGHVRLLAC